MKQQTNVFVFDNVCCRPSSDLVATSFVTTRRPIAVPASVTVKGQWEHARWRSHHLAEQSVRRAFCQVEGTPKHYI